MREIRNRRFYIAVLVAVALAAPAAAGFFDALAGALGWTVELAALLAQKEPRLKEIYLTRFGPGGPAGTLHPSLTVAADGTVAAVDIETDTVGDADFARALSDEIRTWNMPETTYSMTLGFDLTFDPARELYGVAVEAE